MNQIGIIFKEFEMTGNYYDIIDKDYGFELELFIITDIFC
jgi:hypothetical protein